MKEEFQKGAIPSVGPIFELRRYQEESHMTTRQWLGLIASVLALTVDTSGSSADERNKQGCSPLGSWFGFDATTNTASWMSTFHGQTPSSGTYVLDIPGIQASQFLPTTVRASTSRGTWQRTGGNTIAFTVISFALDAGGQTVGIAKLRGTETMMEKCNTLFITNTLALYAPNVNPFQSQGYPIQLLDHHGYRMRLDPPAN